jgi:hypothetical protein
MAKAESLGWYALSLADRLAILKAAGFKRELVRTCLKPWPELSKVQRRRIINMDWRSVLAQ